MDKEPLTKDLEDIYTIIQQQADYVRNGTACPKHIGEELTMLQIRIGRIISAFKK